MSRLKIFFADCARVVDKKLENLIPAAQTEPKRLHAAIRWSLFAGGKRFRPALCIAVGEA
ncbi:MAG: geranyl transferase, partial [Acidobacteria bacterium]|nr:geranyl transferase [Acidobacteriota bacterium]